MRLLDVQDLTVSFPQHDGVVQAVRGMTLHLDAGESLGIVGESGSGKSVTCMAALRLLREPPARIAAARLTLGGVNVLTAKGADLASLRGRVAAMIFQDPMTAFDPSFTIGHQIVETIRAHRATPKPQARAEAADLLSKVEIKNPAAILDSYPHQLSGGMLQRAMIAMALSCRPQLLFADEPTTALDVTIQAQILQLIKELQAELGMGLVMVTHDLGVVAETVDRVLVMYGGRVMEQGPAQAIFDAPAHPYTQALLQSMPGRVGGRQRLTEIPGASPNPANPPSGCPFHPRCAVADARCAAKMPTLAVIVPHRQAACWRLT
jgi:oligopeptide/dipeptide ABC transporter ATP-binding protein